MNLYTIINEDCHIIIDTKENMTRYYKCISDNFNVMIMAVILFILLFKWCIISKLYESNKIISNQNENSLSL